VGSAGTYEVTDEHGEIPEEDVQLTSSDPGEKVGAVSDSEDGTYSAMITASTTPGAAAIRHFTVLSPKRQRRSPHSQH
jgi:hypothetical protein